MFNIVLVHIGDNIPPYISDCINQIKIFNPDVPLYLLVDVEKNPQVVNLDIEIVDINNMQLEDFEHNKNKNYISHIEQLFETSSIRFFYLNKFISDRKLENIIHFENDVLLYQDVSKLEYLKNYKLAVTDGGLDRMMTGFMFIKNNEAIQEFIDFIKGERFNVKNNDMFLLKSFFRRGKIIPLPILPDGQYSHCNDFDKFDSIFDCASWGQFVGGTYHKKIPGFYTVDHFIGVELSKGIYDVEFIEEEGLKIPYVNKNGNKTRLNNLHIHCKQLKKYMSK